MRHPRVAALRAGFYVAIALSSFAAAYALKEWLPHLWGTPHPARIVPASDSPDDDDQGSPRSSSQQDHPPVINARQTDRVPSPVPAPGSLADPGHSFSPLSPNTGAPAPPPTSQSKILSPLLTHSLPPPVPSGHVLSGPSFGAIPSPTIAGSPRTLSGEDGVEGEAAAQTNASDVPADSFLDVLSPSPTHVISRRRSMRTHDLFAASHISFTELGSLIAPEEDI